jgi:hypothetical protein
MTRSSTAPWWARRPKTEAELLRLADELASYVEGIGELRQRLAE